MDTGDVRGDLYFYLDQFLLPVECNHSHQDPMAKFDCDNPERVDPDLVVSKVDLEIDTRWTTYSGCNLCNGTDPFSGEPCEEGSYKCDCFGMGCNKHHVGRESIRDKFLPPHTTEKCNAAMNATCGSVSTDFDKCIYCLKTKGFPLMKEGCHGRDLMYYCSASNPEYHICGQGEAADWECWRANLPRKTSGYWYSTLAEGRCHEGSKEGSCGWKLQSTTSVMNTCLENRLIRTVESSHKGCFDECGPRNTTSACWIGCFFDAVLGEQARNSTVVTGLPLEALIETFESSFVGKHKGGCPIVPDRSILDDSLDDDDVVVV